MNLPERGPIWLPALRGLLVVVHEVHIVVKELPPDEDGRRVEVILAPAPVVLIVSKGPPPDEDGTLVRLDLGELSDRPLSACPMLVLWNHLHDDPVELRVIDFLGDRDMKIVGRAARQPAIDRFAAAVRMREIGRA